MNQNIKIQNKKGALSSALLIIISAVCAFGLPFVEITIVAGALVLITSAVLIVTAERRFSAILLLAGLISLFLYEDGIALVAIALSLVVGCGAFARALEKLSSPFLWAIPVAAFVTSALITKSALMPMLSLGFALPALALKISFSKKYARAAGICLVSGAFMIGTAILLLADMYFATGTISLKFFEENAELYRRMFTELLLQFETINPTTGETEILFSELDAKNLASEIVSLFPAFFVIMCNAAAWISQKLMYMLVKREGELHKFEDKMIALILSPMAGITFVASFVIMMTASADQALIYTVSENIFYIFIPGLAISGIMFQLAKISRLRRGAWVIIPFVILAFVNIAIALILAACLGAYYSIAAPVYQFINSHRQDEE